ncbi:uncharacterized protein LAJ45_05765 [Morchella importuna]|uniref:Uncharacterized protein n=1 Tax=Morchella conica CCBAS932 TaxID=1392247 RepID=A0A3N4KIJ5_9PEZI|nr:uncharacterized protein LAJ45_05765 [Morchella importuna]KAH8150079.1 hypothetical protein LAJ45_05765 [Morchella importuna]RPB08191.1 hypothetical protein P167DRAFT_578551 [Morchella conica CCBAS932]
MQLTTVLLLSLTALINAAPAPVPAPADSAQAFSYTSCLTVSYDTPQGIAFYQIENKDSATFAANCKKCIGTTTGCGTSDTVCKNNKFNECAKTL